MGDSHKCDRLKPDWGCRVREFLVLLGICNLLSSAYLAVLLDASNRQDLFWNRVDTVALFLVIAAATAVMYAAFLLLNRLTGGRFAVIGRHGIFPILAVGFIQLVPQKFLTEHGWPVDATYGAIVGIGFTGAVISVFLGTGKLAAAMRRVAMGLALIYPILFVQILRFPPFIARDDLGTHASRPEGTSSPSVVILSFDSISMAQCLDENGDWRSDLPEIGKLRLGAVCFDNAMACGGGTTMSVPNLLFQRDPAQFGRGRWSDSWFAVDPSIFTNGLWFSAKQQGYRTGVVGLYLPFGQMFGPLLDEARDFTLFRYVVPDSFAHRCANQAISLVDYARGPFDGGLIAEIPRLRYVPGWLNEKHFKQITDRQRAAVQSYLENMPATGRFFYVHMGIPHSPAIFLPDGTVDSIRATYDSQLRYADKVVGEFIATLKENGTYEACWVILTSDHGHHGFDLPPDQHRHVPFVVKAPGSAYAQRVDAKLRLWELAPYFKAVFSGAPAAECLAEMPVELKLE